MKTFAKFLIPAVLFFLCTSCGKKLKFDDSVPADHKTLIQNDLQNLDSTNITDNSEAEVLGISDFSSRSLQNWFADRARYIVGESYDYQNTRQTIAQNFNYNPSLVSQFDVFNVGASDSKAVTVMSNIGAQTYLDGQKASTVYSMTIAGDEVKITSGRSGVFREGEGFLTAIKIPNSDLTSLANSYVRASTLFHEARHDDSHGATVVNAHAKCPSDFAIASLQNQFGCEQYTNGPYMVGRVLLKKLREQCTTCTSAEKDAMDKQVANWASRLDSKAIAADQTPEEIKL